MLACRLREGQSVTIGDRTLTLLSVQRPGAAIVMLDGPNGGDRFGLLWDRKTMILPETYASVDRKNSFNNRITVHLSAPPEVKIRIFGHDGHDKSQGDEEC